MNKEVIQKIKMLISVSISQGISLNEKLDVTNIIIGSVNSFARLQSDIEITACSSCRCYSLEYIEFSCQWFRI